MNRRPTTMVAVTVGVIAAAATITACAAPASRYRTDAIAFIDSDPMFDAYGVVFEHIECAEPESTDEDETVSCQADGDDGQSYTFVFTIVGKNRLELTQIRLDGTVPSAHPGPSEPESTEPAETAPEPADQTDGSVTAAPTTAAGSAVTAPAPAGPGTTTAPTTAAPAVTTTASPTTTTTTTAATTTTTTPG